MHIKPHTLSTSGLFNKRDINMHSEVGQADLVERMAVITAKWLDTDCLAGSLTHGCNDKHA
jgi:hypothetical protein